MRQEATQKCNPSGPVGRCACTLGLPRTKNIGTGREDTIFYSNSLLPGVGLLVNGVYPFHRCLQSVFSLG